MRLSLKRMPRLLLCSVSLALVTLSALTALAQPEITVAQPAAAASTVDPIAVVASALDVDPARVAIQDSQPTEHGSCRRVVAIVEAADAEARQVIVEYEPDNGLLRRIAWVGREVVGEGAVSLEEALEQAQVLMTRLFPAIPYEMQLVEAMPHGTLVTRDRAVHSPLVYSFGWRGDGPGGASTGDLVGAYISTITGEPFSYHQRVAPKRPDLEDIQISQERAIEVAIGSTMEMWRQARDLAVTADAEQVRLVLSSPLSQDNGPVWLVDMAVTREATGEQLERTQRAVDAMSGEILR